MKFIKENWLIVIIVLMSIVIIYSFVIGMNTENDLIKKIESIESEKDILKSEVAKKEIEIKKIRTQKAEIVKSYDFDLINKDKTIQELKDNIVSSI